MDRLLQKFQDLKIQPEEIEKATNNFDQKNFIGSGGFGKVYKGKMSRFEGRSMVGIKHLNRAHGQGDAEFLKEITSLSRYRHENIISLLGFCYQGNDACIVYELASRGSLDKYLSTPDLTWSKRIKICLDAAKGLRHLHDPRGTHQRLIHCDVKSANILLDEQWNAKVADFGFSIAGPANELQSTVINLAAGTLGYCDPQYALTNTLTKESDVYSFGVVLVEVLCGALCYTSSNDSVQYNLVPTFFKSYQEKKLSDIIYKDPAIQPLDQSVLEIISGIAYQCFNEYREDRPDMAFVVTELEHALNIHNLLQNPEFKAKWDAHSFYYKEMAKIAEPPLNYTSDDELKNLLSEGVLLNGGKTWFSLNKMGEHCEMISIVECLDSEFKRECTKYKSRFPKGAYHSEDGIFKTSVNAQFLSPGITYTVNLVFRFLGKDFLMERDCRLISLKYKLQGERESSISYLAYEREDGWWMCELYQFTCDHRIINLQILFGGFTYCVIDVEGIEFRPLEKMEHKEDDNQPISDSDSDSYANYEEKLPTDYEDIMKRSEDSVQWTTKEEAYSIMSKGFFINNEHNKRIIWFSLDKNGKKCLMISARQSAMHFFTHSLPLPASRFGEAFLLDSPCFVLRDELQSQLLSSETAYAIYLVYKFSKGVSGFEVLMNVMDEEYLGSGDKNRWYIYLAGPPQTPVIKPKADEKTHNPPNKLIKESLPKLRNDGWMEVQLLKFRSITTTETILMRLQLLAAVDTKKKFKGLIIEGVEFRPIG